MAREFFEVRRRRRPPYVAIALVVVVMLAVAYVAGTQRGARQGASPAPEPRASSSPSTPARSSSPTPSPTPSPTSPELASFADTFEATRSGVARIDVDGCDSSGHGTGFLVGDRRVATAAHVVTDAVDITVTVGSTKVPAEVVGIDRARDLAVLQLDQNVRGHVFELADDDAAPGTEVATIGFPGDEPLSLAKGAISGTTRAVETEGGWHPQLQQTDTAINPGNSGGPVMTMDGTVVGVVDASLVSAQGINFVVPASVSTPAFAAGVLPDPVAPWCSDDLPAYQADVQETMTAYFDAINTLDYDAAMAELDPDYAQRLWPSEEAWQKGYESSYDDQPQIVSASASDSTAWIRFRSFQAPGAGPTDNPDAPCLIWSIDYAFERVDGRLRITRATHHEEPAWTECDPGDA